MVFPRRVGLATASALVALLSACGPSNNSDPSEPGPPQQPTGRFLNVEGLTFSSQSHSGVTGENGSFDYAENEAVTFSLGDLELGTTLPKAIISPFDLVQGSEPITGNLIIRREIAANLEYNHVINLMTLLTTLDDDLNPNNGIQISKPVSQSITEMDFHQPYFDFYHGEQFRGLLDLLNSNGLFTDHRLPAKSWWGMQLLHQQIGIDAAWALTSTDTDFDADGTVDSSSTPTVYNTLGQIETESSSSGGHQRHHYDFWGNLVRTTEYYSNGDVSRETYSDRDETGRVTERRVDFGADGDFESIHRYKLGDLPFTSYTEYVDPDTLEVTSIYYTTKNALGDLVETSRDAEANGVLDRIERYTYDDLDRLILHTKDNDGDTEIDGQSRWIYGPQEGFYERRNEDGNQVASQILQYQEDEAGRLTSYYFDANANGFPELFDTYTYNEFGLRVTHVSNQDGMKQDIDDEIDFTREYEYQDGLYLTRVHRVNHPQDTLSNVQINTYDENKNVASKSTSQNDETITRIEHYNYQALGGWHTVFRRLEGEIENATY